MAVTKALIRDSDWIRDERFDSTFIFGLLFLALITGAVVIAEPRLFYPVLVIDLWFLGYHHVIATYTRLCFDRQSLRENRSLIFGLLPAVAAATLLAAWQLGIWVVVTTYFYWQWWHYARQSWGMSRIYRSKRPDALYEDGWLDTAIFYALPVTGILVRSSQGHESFLGLELRTFPVPGIAATATAVVTAGLLAYWVMRRVEAARQGRLSPVHTLYMLTHFAIFAAGYCLVSDINVGWLMINIWHNAQYILFVWLFNTKRFRNGIDPEARFLSYISQPGRLWLYMVTCLAITGAIYWGVLRTIDWLFFAGLSATLVLYQIVNFHHYLVDSVIWKVRKPKMQATLDLKG
jgi:hypothetical protein